MSSSSSTELLSIVDGIIEPACASDGGCEQLDRFVVQHELGGEQRERLLGSCVGYCLSSGSDQVCLLNDSPLVDVNGFKLQPAGGQNA